MYKTIFGWLIFAGLAVALIFFYRSTTKPELPAVAVDGSVKGEYSIASIMALNQPYRCDFEKKDETSSIVGIVTTDGKNIYGEFKINTELVKEGFRSFLLVRGSDTYTWTSLSNVGYQSRVANSASKNASPEEQTQIIGLKDKMQYECKPLAGLDQSTFEVPTFIQFPDLQ